MESIKGPAEKIHFLTDVSARLSGRHDNKSIALKRKGEEGKGVGGGGEKRRAGELRRTENPDKV